MALWGARFSEQADKRLQAFNASISIDQKMVNQDIKGSIAHVTMLADQGIIETSDKEAIISNLKDIQKEIADGSLPIDPDAEDIHMFIEAELTKRTPSGKKVHTARSRNDQVATDFKLYSLDTCAEIKKYIVAMIQTLLHQAKANTHTIMPGYTHLQRAQPITFAHHLMAYVEMFDRDYHRLTNCQKMMDTCPLGSAALAGTAYPIDREILAGDLGFARATRNSLDSVSDRDHVLELLSCASISMVHLSRMAEDIIFYNSGESAFFELSDKVTSGSSLMPQKKNPDACELIRGKSGRVFGSLMGMLATLKGLPLAYNKDMQEDKEGLFDALDTWHDCLDMACLVFEDIKVNKEKTLSAAKGGYSNATELADYLVSKGIPFREAHHIVGETVVYAIKSGKPLEDLQVSEFKQFCDKVEDDVYPILTIESILKKRCAKGGVSLEQIKSAIDFMNNVLSDRS